jgi:hypothetical protein
VALPIWLALLLLINASGLWLLVTYVNPQVAPNWQPFHFSAPLQRYYPGHPPTQ